MCHLRRNQLTILTTYTLLLIAISFFYFHTIRAGHHWGGDFALYISHAKNIAEAKPYGETKLVKLHSSDNMPAAYPPGYPVPLSLMYQHFGDDLEILKIPAILAFILFLIIFLLYCRKKLHSQIAIFGAFISCALSPLFWDLKDQIMSDIQFTLFLYISFLAIAFRLGPGTVWRKLSIRSVVVAAVVTLAVYFAIITRSVGILILPAFLISAARSKDKSYRLFLVIITGFIIALIALQKLIFRSGSDSDGSPISSQIDSIVGMLDWEIILRNVINYGTHYASLWKNFLPSAAKQDILQYVLAEPLSIPYFILLITLSVGTLLLAMIGALRIFRDDPEPGDYFAIIYISMLLVLPYATHARYLAPLLPIVFIYIFRGAEQVANNRLGKLSLGMFPHVLVSIILVSYVGTYANASYSPRPIGVEVEESKEFFKYVRENTPDNSLIVFIKPRVLALFTNRYSARARAKDVENLRSLFTQHGVTHIVLKDSTHASDIQDSSAFRSAVASHKDELKLLFSNRHFRLYKLLHDTPVRARGGEGGGT